VIAHKGEVGFRYGRQKLQRRKRYPHLGGHDAQVWDEWVQNQDREWDWVSYDVLLGEHEAETEYQGTGLERLAAALLRPRADVALCSQRRLYVCEIKPVLAPGSIGQALVYSYLAARQCDEFKVVFPVVVCRQAYRHLIDAAGAVGVGVWLSSGSVCCRPSPV